MPLVKLWVESSWPGQEAHWTMPTECSLDAKMEHWMQGRRGLGGRNPAVEASASETLETEM